MDSDLAEFNRIVRLDVTELVSVYESAQDDLLGWVQGMNIEATHIEVAGTWPPISTTSPTARESTPTNKSDEPQRMFSLGEPPIEHQQAKRLTRFCSIRYFRQMYPYRHYPLAVLFADRTLRTIKLKRIEDLSNVATLLVDANDPRVQVKVVFPGCLTVPETSSVDLSGDKAIARFWITPISKTTGELKHAYVEIWYQGDLLERISTPATIARQRDSETIPAGESYWYPPRSAARKRQKQHQHT